MRESLKKAMEKFGGKSVTVVECGVMTGANARQMLDNLNVHEMFLVDFWSVNYRPNAIESLVKACDEFKENDGVVHIIKMHSQIAACKLDIKADFIYLDSSHDPEYLYEEMCLWWKRLKAGGILSGHDYDLGQPTSVKAAVERFCEKNDLCHTYTGNNDNETVGDWIIHKD